MTDQPTSFELELAEQARQFKSSHSSDNDGGRAYIVVDLEFLFDRDAHRAYLVSEGATAEKSIRWPFHQVAAASWLTMRFRLGEDIPEITGPVTVALDEMDELFALDLVHNLGLHPGTVDTDLSKPFQGAVKPEKLFTPEFSAAKLLQVIDQATPADSGDLFDWAGQRINF